jgi:hypothetical protein
MRCERVGAAELWLGDWRSGNFRNAVCVLTDPPYGIKYSSGHATDALWSENRIRGDLDTTARDEMVALFSGAPQLVFGSWRAPRPSGVRAVLIWNKGPALGMGALDIPWKPSYEEIYVLGRGFVGTRDEGAVIYHPPVQSMAKNGRLHPNEKPIGLLRHLLQKMPAGCVADPFMGSGSSGAAAVLEGRPFVGAEIDERYFDIACRRIEAAQRQADLFIQQPTPDLDAAYQRQPALFGAEEPR